MSEWVTVGTIDDVQQGGMRGAQLDDLWLAIARPVDGPPAAFAEWCSHEECQLSEGDLEGERVVCYCHGAAFDIRSGAVLNGPATEPIDIYEIRERDGELQVKLPQRPEQVRWTEWRL